MIDERNEELASLYTVGLLTGEELAAFEKLLTQDAELRAFTKALQNSAAHLALTPLPAAPSAELRARIFASIDKLDTKAAPSTHRKVIPFLWSGWAVAAGFAVLAGYLGTMWVNSKSQLQTQKDLAAISSLELRNVQQKSEADHILASRQIADLQRESGLAQLKIARLAMLNGNSPEAVAIAVWNPLKQEGLLTVEDLPRIHDDQSYQLWVVDAHHKNPVSGGVFSVDAKGHARLDFHPTEPTDAATHFAISRERRGGVPVREGPIVALGAL